VDDATQLAVAERLSIVVGRFNRRIRTATGGLSQGLLSALATVARCGPLRLADLAAIETVSAPSITRIVADLEARGLVARSADPLDGRAALIALTIEGGRAVTEARAARTEATSELLDVLGASDLASVAAALPALESMVGSPGVPLKSRAQTLAR
jgi:DNA-binding MarR family transcriptional regulator